MDDMLRVEVEEGVGHLVFWRDRVGFVTPFCSAVVGEIRSNGDELLKRARKSVDCADR